MGRKSLARERRAQILDAFEACILERGLDGASIASIAGAAGMDRTMVHHYFGNRRSLESALLDRLAGVYKSRRDAAVASLPSTDRKTAVLDYLFGPAFGDRRLGAVFDELFAASNRSGSTKRLLLRDYKEFEQVTNAEVEKAYPDAPAPRRREVAYAVMCLAESCSKLVRLGFPAARRADARASAEALLHTLEKSSTA